MLTQRALRNFFPMSRFPVFNTPMQSDSPKAMEVDEGDISVICEGLSLVTPKKNAPATRSTISNSVPVSPFIPSTHPSIPLVISKPQPTGLSRISSIFSGSFGNLDEDTMRKIALLPYMMSGYIQLLLNISFPTFFLYWVYSFGCTIQTDVEKKVQLFSEEVMEQIAKCSRDYMENRCDPETRVPALISACQAWEECMARDPHLVAKRSGLAAEIFGETLNSFFNALSWKSIASLVLMVVGVSVLFNVTFSMTRKDPHHERESNGHRLKQGGHNQLTNGPSPKIFRRNRKF